MIARIVTAGAMALFVSAWLPGTALALPYDGTNPGATECGDGSHSVYVLAEAFIFSGAGNQIGRVELRHSPYCATVWSRVYNETNDWVDVREKLITYTSPNGGGATTYTETDTLSPEGGATDSGWSKQYRDRPGFMARGEILRGGVWRQADTVRGVMYAQFDGNYPNNPWTCDDTATNYCHRYRTAAGGGPITLQYAFDPNLSLLPSSPNADITYVLGKYEDLSGSSPNLDATTPENADILFYSYAGTNETLVYARSQSAYLSGVFPQYYVSGYTKFNRNGPAIAGGDYRPLVCHEFGHVLGMLDMVHENRAATRASCVGANYNQPKIDDEQAWTKIFSTPLANN